MSFIAGSSAGSILIGFRPRPRTKTLLIRPAGTLTPHNSTGETALAKIPPAGR